MTTKYIRSKCSSCGSLSCPILDWIKKPTVIKCPNYNSNSLLLGKPVSEAATQPIPLVNPMICQLAKKCRNISCHHKYPHSTRNSMGTNLCKYPCQSSQRPKGTNAVCVKLSGCLQLMYKGNRKTLSCRVA